ncbi:hypothetical protein DERP_006601 [Dermatophagoides pteronyssinus]|uniref:Cysteine-rich PDZ-binding protein n=1 Tax=Dermatophagoides pteronyssinus TaxID=6956 RepID=A0ABQ8IQY3_DERPT|nr:hypothetical protein DERP_006601 [Dermatophagoides pteronyssinus]
MVCNKCQKKLGKIITPDVWKSGARNTTVVAVQSMKIKHLTSRKNRFQPYQKFETCKICKQKVHQAGSHYCQSCAYKKGICAMCGSKIYDTKSYCQSSV